MLSLEKISYNTPLPRNKEVFKDISISIKKGEHTCIAADNGAGKTTLAKIFMRFIEPSKGKVVGGAEEAYMFFENFYDQFLFSTLIEEIEATGADIQSAEQVLNSLGIADLRDKPILELSYSQKARLIMSLAYLSGREYILLDCPPSDKNIDTFINRLINNGERTLVMFVYDQLNMDRYQTSWSKWSIENCSLIKL